MRVLLSIPLVCVDICLLIVRIEGWTDLPDGPLLRNGYCFLNLLNMPGCRFRMSCCRIGDILGPKRALSFDVSRLLSWKLTLWTGAGWFILVSSLEAACSGIWRLSRFFPWTIGSRFYWSSMLWLSRREFAVPLQLFNLRVSFGIVIKSTSIRAGADCAPLLQLYCRPFTTSMQSSQESLFLGFDAITLRIYTGMYLPRSYGAVFENMTVLMSTSLF